MKRRQPLFVFLLAGLAFAPIAGAYTMPDVATPGKLWWHSQPTTKYPKAPLPTLQATPISVGVGSTVTREGRIVRFDVWYNDQPAQTNALVACRADVDTGDGKGFTLVFAPDATLRDSDPRAELFFFRQTAACLSARRAHLQGLPVSVRGVIESLGSENGLASVKALGFTAFPANSDAAPRTDPTAPACEPGACQLEGTVGKVSYNVRDSGFLCEAALKIAQTDGNVQEADLKVGFPEDMPGYRWLNEFQNSQLLHAKLQACETLEAAAGTDKTVRVEGKAQGAGVWVSSVVLEDAPPAQLDSLF